MLGLENLGLVNFTLKNINAYYWKGCVHLWKSGYDSEEVMERIMNPMKGL